VSVTWSFWLMSATGCYANNPVQSGIYFAICHLSLSAAKVGIDLPHWRCGNDRTSGRRASSANCTPSGESCTHSVGSAERVYRSLAPVEQFLGRRRGAVQRYRRMFKAHERPREVVRSVIGVVNA
jgi:hypothetical protein